GREVQVTFIRGLRLMLYATTFVSGFVALGLEVLWTRMLAEGTGSLIYNFAVILAVYLLGISLGGGIYRAVSRPDRDTPLLLAVAILGIAISTLITVPLGTLWLGPSHPQRAVMMLPATICMGYAFPLTARLLTSDPDHGARSIGLLYAWNTIGAILGSLTATFILAGSLGTNASILTLAAADAAVGLALTLLSRPSFRRRSLATPAIALMQLAVIATSSVVVASGSPLLKTATEHWLDANHEPYRHVEDDLSTVDAVGGTRSHRRLYLSGTAMSALSVDTKLMAYLPKLLRPRASSFLDIAFGMGTTYRSAITLGMRTDAVDLSPSAPQQMSTFYSDAGAYLHNRLGRIIAGDGRNYVRLTSDRYDIISVDPPPPVQAAGAVVLYTSEFYADAHRRLKPGGVMLQWLYFGVTLTELREHLRSFRSQFRHVDILLSPMEGGVYMLGSDAPLEWDGESAVRILDSPEARADIGDAPDSPRLGGRSWPDILNRMRWLQDAEVDKFAGQAPLITDDHPRTEYYFVGQTLGWENRRYVTAALLRRLHPTPAGSVLEEP
ncbi:MAG: fused MFS/spermidine synthase, partial [Candidatus Dormibacteraeota bacterium]|nr:fused MFS/spermidine synthase [Candidatus Dormibacteraeota bacterium]